MNDDPSPGPGDPPGPDGPEFGPSGYLPQRAAKRARKIVLRAPLGMQWIIGAVVVGVAVVVVGVVFLVTAGGPPGPPFVEVGPVDGLAEGQLAGGDADDGRDYLSVEAGRVRIFHLDPTHGPFAWCEASRQFEGPGGVWSPTGRGLGGTESLQEHPTVIVDGLLFWDPTRLDPPPVPDPAPAERGCDEPAVGQTLTSGA